MLTAMARPEPKSSSDGPPDRIDGRRLAVISVWGAATTTVAWLVSGGSIPWFIVAMVTIGVGQRLLARYIWLRAGHELPRWWWK